MTSAILIDITIPVLNEEETLRTQVLKVREYIQKNLTGLGDIRLVIADNGSNDGTEDIAKLLQAKFKDIQYLRLEERGVGRALKASWGKSRADIVGYMDLDLATDLKHLKPALQELVLDNVDIVTGSRLAHGARVVGRKPLRTFTSKSFNLLVKNILNTSFSDGMCGFKFLRRSILQDLMACGAQNDGWFFATELLATAEHLGYRLYDMPVVWTDDPNSKVKIAKLTKEYMRSMFALRTKIADYKRLQKNI